MRYIQSNYGVDLTQGINTGKRIQIDYQYNSTYKTRLDDIIIGEDTIHITYDRYYALNPTSITKNNQVYKLAFEGTQLTKIGEHINYSYDILGRRVEKIIQGKSTKYIYDDNQIVEIKEFILLYRRRIANE
ncbi:MAG: hypothetical protein NC090_00330 [Anaeroplasma bactoclasticum]|nr:hypothetical protein [Anaeroplasma bactoclasticum]